jgi:hypothetical protein
MLVACVAYVAAAGGPGGGRALVLAATDAAAGLVEVER